MPWNRSFGPPPSSCRTRFLCQDACSRRWTPVLVIHNCISDFVALSLHHCISDFVASSLLHCISDFVASSLRRFVASSLRRFVASSLHCICGSVVYVVFCFSCSGCQGPWVPRSSAVINNFSCLGVKIRWFLVVFPLRGRGCDALGGLLAVGGSCGGSFGAGAHGAGSGVPRPAGAYPSAAPSAGTAVFGLGVESRGKAAGGGPSHKLIGHLHFLIQRLWICVVPSCFLSAIVALCRVILSLLSDCRFLPLTRLATVHSSLHISEAVDQTQQQQQQHQLQPQ
jgi:hypothetical protein